MAAMQRVATDLVPTQPAMTAGVAQQAAMAIPEAEQEQTGGAVHLAMAQELTVQDGSCNVVRGVHNWQEKEAEREKKGTERSVRRQTS